MYDKKINKQEENEKKDKLGFSEENIQEKPQRQFNILQRINQIKNTEFEYLKKYF